MYLVDEENIALFEIGHDRGQVAGALNRGTGRYANTDAEFPRDDMRKRSLAEPGRSGKEHMIEHLTAFARRLDRHSEDLPRPHLSDELVERARPQGKIKRAVFFGPERGSRRCTAVAVHFRLAAALRHPTCHPKARSAIPG